MILPFQTQGTTTMIPTLPVPFRILCRPEAPKPIRIRIVKREVV